MVLLTRARAVGGASPSRRRPLRYAARLSPPSTPPAGGPRKGRCRPTVSRCAGIRDGAATRSLGSGLGGRLGLGLRLLDDLLLEPGGEALVLEELHAEARLALRHAPQVVGVAEHLGEGDL